MNIALFASAFYPHVGGVEELCRQLAHAYRAQGHTCAILTNRWPRSLPRFEHLEGIPIYRLPMRTPGGPLRQNAMYRLTHAAICREMLRILRDQRTDVLHVQCVSSNGYYGLLAKRAEGLPLIVTSQGERVMDAGRLYEYSSFANETLRQLLTEADYVTACSLDTLTDLEQFHGNSLRDRAEVVHNGIRVADFEGVAPHHHPRPYLLGIGRLVPQKGFDVLIRAFAAARPPGHDLLIAGEGSELQALKDLTRALGAERRVRFVGRADRSAAVALFLGCSFFALPSRIEPLGIVNLEAMAAGKAVVASRVGGVPEVVLDGQTGLLVPPGQVTELAGAITRLCETPALATQLGARGRNWVRGLDWSLVAQRYLRIYRQAARNSKPGGELTTRPSADYAGTAVPHSRP